METSPGTTTYVAGRLVVHRRGGVTQTVNICTPTNKVGVYEARYRLPIAVDVLLQDIAAQPDLGALRGWLLERGTPISLGMEPGVGLPELVSAVSADDAWLAEAKIGVEATLTAVVEQFLHSPYLHRVEHSLHAELYLMLKKVKALDQVVTLRSGERTQLVHKEWPETIPRPSTAIKAGRGLFDLAILAPSQVGKATLEQFRAGRIDAPIVIEVGLDYGFAHLKQDALKLINSKVVAPYLLHLTRKPLRDIAATDELLCSPPGSIRTAFVHHDPRTGNRFKHLTDSKIQLS